MKIRIAYLVNQYPAVSHSFIRREILALERLDVNIVRYALRPSFDKLVDPEDLQEKDRTKYILQVGIFHLLASLLRALIFKPIRSFRMMRLVIRTGRRSHRGLLRHFAYAAEAAVLASWCQRDGVDHVHAHFGTNTTSIAMFAQCLSSITFSFTIHGPEEFENAPLLSLNVKLCEASFAVCVSSFGKSQLMLRSDPDQWTKISIVHCGVSEHFIDAPSSPPSSSFKLLCVGRLVVQKAQFTLVAAAKQLRERNKEFHLVFAGDGPMRLQLEEAIKEAGLSRYITITGWISGERVIEEILSSRALVLPSFSENLPVVIMEALALGRPVLSTYIAGIPELVENGRSGWLVPAADEAALLDALIQILDASQEHLAEMGTCGRKKVMAEHNVMIEAAKLKALFEQGMHKDGRSLAMHSDIRRGS